MELSYCVVNTNGREFLLTCLEAMAAPTRRDRAEILVLDNASDDGSREAVARRFPEARVIAHDRRGGLARTIRCYYARLGPLLSVAQRGLRDPGGRTRPCWRR